MAHINKLAIRGIRSFDDKQISVIEFFSPVTVIVGHNGSGKTTIIECLKYATTGDQPPNTRGGAFVHDPKMANEKEVKAQVKLRFHAANGKRMLAVRNLSVTVKKTSGLTMKTLESILALADGEEKGGKVRLFVHISPERLILPKPISNSAALFPQSVQRWTRKFPSCSVSLNQCSKTSSSVIKRILTGLLPNPRSSRRSSMISLKLQSNSSSYLTFTALTVFTRYTKALDSIKGLRKDRVAELKAENERLEGLEREKGHADKLKKRVEAAEKEIATKEADHSKLKQDYDAIVITNRAFYDRGTKFREIFTRVENLEEQLKNAQADYNESKQHIDILNSRSLVSFDHWCRLKKVVARYRGGAGETNHGL